MLHRNLLDAFYSFEKIKEDPEMYQEDEKA